VADHLPSKCEALSSNSHTIKKLKKGKKFTKLYNHHHGLGLERVHHPRIFLHEQLLLIPLIPPVLLLAPLIYFLSL
jgi:hypothetical protein